MNATATPAPVTVSNDLLTGMEWSPAQVRELHHLAADLKAHPGSLPWRARRPFPGHDF